MQYPLNEKIGDPALYVERHREHKNFNRWIDFIPRRISKSRVILARRKSGKTAFVQRIFNRLWHENGPVIPFYYEVKEVKMWLMDLALSYYRTFASQYISFLERDARKARRLMTLEEIYQYAESKGLALLVKDIKEIRSLQSEKNSGMAWDLAYHAPHRYADIMDIRFLVIIDEFQNFSQYFYRDEACETAQDETIPGSFHSVSESKIAPMLVTGSYVRWLLNICSQYLQAGRLSVWKMNAYLSPEEGLQAVYRYAEVYGETITNENAALINRLCMSDPFFIACVFQSSCEEKDLSTEEGITSTVRYEIHDRNSEMSLTWGQYIELTLQRINDIHAKNILLHLSKHSDREWTPQEIKDALGMEISTREIHKRLRLLVESDMIEEGISDIDYKGLGDGTLNLILRNRFEKEILGFAPDLKQEAREEIAKLKKDRNRLRGMLNNLSGKVAEFQLANAFRSRKRFPLSDFFDGASDETRLNITDVKLRVHFQRPDGKDMEVDVLAASSCGRTVLVEVKKTKTKTGVEAVRDFYEKWGVYGAFHPGKTVLPTFVSIGGFTDEAAAFCKEKGIGTAVEIRHMLDG